jgi:hypothetical protein
MTQRLINPLPFWLNRDGDLLDGGYIYLGVAGADPQVSPVTAYWDKDLTIVATQPLRTRGGYVVNGANPADVYVDEDDYSVRARDFDMSEVLYRASTIVAGIQYQPLDGDLTAIAALATTSYGRALLTLANTAALKAATGIPDPIPAIGGTTTGNITRSGAGVHLYHNNGALTSGRVFVTASGAADPTSLPGDIWLEEAP